MLVNSIVFVAFFLVVLLPYFSVLRKNSKLQNLLILVASYFFYAYADWRMVALLLAATVLFFLLGRGIENCQKKKEGRRAKLLMISGVVAGVGLLLYFKYLNFFIEQFSELFALFGLKTNWSTFQLIVPIGISFFTFKLISYVVEIYKNNIHSERDFVDFAAYIAFFPTIMSGPIDKANDFLPQLKTPRTWSNAMVLDGFKRVLWGMFLKMCIADKISPYTDSVFNNYYHHSGVTIILASVLYTFQIYADFCGYSEMAIGVGRVMGFRITENFRRPYFATNVGDFWRRWHMSLMNWFRDYIYIPLGGSRCSKAKMYWNTMVVFMVSGLWHGANWTFIIWGSYHGALVCFYKLSRSVECGSKSGNRMKQSISKYGSILFVFVLVTIGWMVFRCDNFHQFFGMLGRFTAPGSLFFSWALTAILPIGIMLLKELKDEEGWNIHLLHSKNLYVQAIGIAFLIIYVFYTGELNGAQFIYFQF